MNQCNDRDLLAVEPVLFLGAAQPAQTLAAGSNAEIAAGQLHAPTADFLHAGILPGMAVTVWTTTASEGNAYEIVSIESPNQLTLSILRADTAVPVLPPPPQTGLNFHILTYLPQIQTVTSALAEKLRLICESAGVDFQSGSFADSPQLRQTITYGCLGDIFLVRSQSSAPGDSNWIKAQHYQHLFRDCQIRLRLAVDPGSSGAASQTRSLGNVNLRRV